MIYLGGRCDQDMKHDHKKDQTLYFQVSPYHDSYNGLKKTRQNKKIALQSPIRQGEGYNCQTNETSGDGSWSNVASQRDWILDQMQPEKRTGASELEDICKYLPNLNI